LIVNLVHLFSAISGLASVHRYSMTRLGSPESVLEHTGMVALTSNLVAREMNALSPGVIDVGEVTFRALVHDLDELVNGDVPRTTKYRDAKVRAMFKDLEEWGIDKIASGLEVSSALQTDISHGHRDAKSGLEGLVVAIVDAMAVCFKVWEEVIVRGNCSMVGHAARTSEQLLAMRNRVSDEVADFHSAILLSGLINQGIEIMCRAASKDDAMFGSEMRT